MTTTLEVDHHRTAADRARARVESLLASGAGVHDALEELVRIVQDSTPSGMIASILILDDDGKHLRHGAGPSLPDAYNRAIDGIGIGPEVGSCGTAAFHGRPVNVYDIAHDPLWANFKDLALDHGLRACWSTPIHDAQGRVLGTFANYYTVVRDPSPGDRELTELITSTAARVIESGR